MWYGSSMIFELHITVDHNDPDFDLGEWQRLCRAIDAKPLDIRLYDADNDRQVMFAAVHEGNDEAAEAWWAWLREEVENSGFKILREKLEVPLDKSGRYGEPPYFETHIKTLIPKDDVPLAVAALSDMGWMCSYNDLFTTDEGREKWYFTWRTYGGHFTDAGREFAAAFAGLREFAWFTVRMESETVIYDSNPDLDKGWA